MKIGKNETLFGEFSVTKFNDKSTFIDLENGIKRNSNGTFEPIDAENGMLNSRVLFSEKVEFSENVEISNFDFVPDIEAKEEIEKFLNNYEDKEKGNEDDNNK